MNSQYPPVLAKAYPNTRGSHSVISGTSVTSASTARLNSKNGHPARTTSPIGTLPIPVATNRHTPSGGGVSPIINLSSAMTEK